MIYWLTGQPSHGKTILAKLLVKHYEKSYIKLFHIDGDDLRGIFNNQDYSKEGRIKNITFAQGLAKFLNIIERMKDFSIIQFGWDDIVRSGIVRDYIMTKELMGLR